MITQQTTRSLEPRVLLDPLAQIYLDFFGDPSQIKYLPNYRVDVSLKQRRLDPLEIPDKYPPVTALGRTIVDTPPQVVTFPDAHLQAQLGIRQLTLNGQVIKSFPDASLSFSDIEKLRSQITARSRRRGCLMRNAVPTHFPFECVTAEEVRKLAMRLCFRLNRGIFKGRSQRTNNPERITAVVCLHDKDTRWHLHILFGVPHHITDTEFTELFETAAKKERFIYRQRVIEPITNLANSMHYNVDPLKSRSGNPVIFDSWMPPEGIEKERTNDRHDINQENSNGFSAVAA